MQPTSVLVASLAVTAAALGAFGHPALAAEGDGMMGGNDTMMAEGGNASMMSNGSMMQNGSMMSNGSTMNGSQMDNGTMMNGSMMGKGPTMSSGSMMQDEGAMMGNGSMDRGDAMAGNRTPAPGLALAALAVAGAALLRARRRP